MAPQPPPLPEGLVAFVKQECETCVVVVPVLTQLAAAADLTVYTQDNPDFPAAPAATHDSDLGLSWHHHVETVPTLIRIVDGVEVGRAVGWMRDQWEALSEVSGLGPDLPMYRPGCGSMSVDPDLVDGLRARHEGGSLRSRRLDMAAQEDDVEFMYTRGFTDGLPVVPPTEARVLKMLTGTSRSADEIVAIVPPDLVAATVEKVAIAAVMAGCLPEYLPWVLAAVEAACNDEFNMHGLLATTMPVGPVLVCSGPGARAVGMNSGVNALGQGNRANSTIGRALQLLVRNLGGGRPGEVDRATLGSPSKLTFCFAENDLDSPLGRLADDFGVEPGADAVTVFAGEGPHTIVDQLSRTPDSLIGSFAGVMQSMHHRKLVLAFDAILVVSPEHGRVFADAGWDRQRVLAELHARLVTPAADLERGAHGIAEGLPAGFEGSLPKYRPGGILLAYAGGGAGLFSALIAGWVNGDTGSQPVTRRVQY